MATIGKLKAILGLDDSKYKKGLNQAQKKTNKFKGAIKKVGGAIAGAFAVSKITQFVSKTINAADRLGKLQKQTGISAEALQKYRYAAERSGISTEKLDTSMQVFQKRLGELRAGTGSLNTRLKKMDPTFMKQLKNAKDAETAFKMYADRMQNASSETEQAALAQAGFSRAGLDMTKLMRGGSKAIKDYGQKAEETGGILSDDLIKASEEFKDKQTNLKMALRGVVAIFIKNLMPVLKQIIDKLKSAAKWVQDNIETIKKWGGIILDVAKYLVAYKAGVIAFNVAMKAYRIATNLAAIAQKGLNKAMKANVIGLIVTALYGLVKGIQYAWKSSAKFRAMFKYATQGVVAFFKKLVIRVEQYAKSIWDAIKTYFGSGLDIMKAFGKAITQVFSGHFGKARDTIANAFSGIVDDFGSIGKEAAKEANKEISKIKSPDYKEILANERAKQMAKDAGYDSLEAWQKGIKEGIDKGQKDVNDKSKESGKEAGEEFAKGFKEGAVSDIEIKEPDVNVEGEVNTDVRETRAISYKIPKESKEALKEYGKDYDQLTAKQKRNVDMTMRLKGKTTEAARAIKGAMVDMAAQTLTALGNMAAGGDMTGKKLAKGLLTTLAGLMKKLGKMAISVGIGIKGIKEALKSLNPAAAIAAGVALLALAGAVTAAVSNMGETGGKGGGGGANMPRMASGGVVPPGYSNDSYPALLTSGEKVIPPKTNKSQKGYIAETSIDMRKLNIKLRENEQNNSRFE